MSFQKYNNFNSFGNKTPLMFPNSIIFIKVKFQKFNILTIFKKFTILINANSYHHAKAWDFSWHISYKNLTEKQYTEIIYKLINEHKKILNQQKIKEIEKDFIENDQV